MCARESVISDKFREKIIVTVKYVAIFLRQSKEKKLSGEEGSFYHSNSLELWLRAIILRCFSISVEQIYKFPAAVQNNLYHQ